MHACKELLHIADKPLGYWRLMQATPRRFFFWVKALLSLRQRGFGFFNVRLRRPFHRNGIQGSDRLSRIFLLAVSYHAPFAERWNQIPKALRFLSMCAIIKAAPFTGSVSTANAAPTTSFAVFVSTSVTTGLPSTWGMVPRTVKMPDDTT